MHCQRVTLLICTLLAIGCGDSQESASPPVTSSSTTNPAPVATSATDTTAPTPIQTSGELKVLTAEDMEKLQKERQQQINRPSALGEEKDPVQDLQKSTATQGRGNE